VQLSPDWEPPGHIVTPEKREALRAFVAIGTVTGAMQAVGMSRQSWYRWQEEDPDFKEAVGDAEQAAADRLEAVAIARATQAKAPSDLLLIFLLKGMRPEKYRERHQHEVTGPNGGPIQHQDVTQARERVRHRLEHLMGGLG
jgi:hypothetical protein